MGKLNIFLIITLILPKHCSLIWTNFIFTKRKLNTDFKYLLIHALLWPTPFDQSNATHLNMFFWISHRNEPKVRFGDLWGHIYIKEVKLVILP